MVSEGDIHVERARNHSRQVTIFDRYGKYGHVSLTVSQAKHVRDQLDRVLDDG